MKLCCMNCIAGSRCFVDVVINAVIDKGFGGYLDESVHSLIGALINEVDLFLC